MTSIYKYPWHAPVRGYSRTLRGRKDSLVLPKLPYGFVVERNSYVSNDAEVCCFRSPHQVSIGRYSSVGRCCFMVDGDHNLKYASTFPFREFRLSGKAPSNANVKPPPRVGNDVWIADGAMILGGVDVGDGAVVAANAVVTKNVPAYAVVAGNPARVVKTRFDDETIARFQRVRWWDLPDALVFERLAPVLDDPERFLHRAEGFREVFRLI